jgi:hypothetical protein
LCLISFSSSVMSCVFPACDKSGNSCTNLPFAIMWADAFSDSHFFMLLSKDLTNSFLTERRTLSSPTCTESSLYSCRSRSRLRHPESYEIRSKIFSISFLESVGTRFSHFSLTRCTICFWNLFSSFS